MRGKLSHVNKSGINVQSLLYTGIEFTLIALHNVKGFPVYQGRSSEGDLIGVLTSVQCSVADPHWQHNKDGDLVSKW
jgi:hypothetical protein